MATNRRVVFSVSDANNNPQIMTRVEHDDTLQGQGLAGDPLGVKGQLSSFVASPYSASTTYSYGSIASQGTHAFVSVKSNNTGHDPFTSPSYWRLIDGTNVLTYSPGMETRRGDVIEDDQGRLWINRADFGTAVTTAPAAGPSWFELGGAGSGTGGGITDWVGTQLYSVGRLVLEGGNVWVSNQENRNHRPSDGGDYWSHIDRPNIRDYDSSGIYYRGQIVVSASRYWLVVANEGVGVSGVPQSGDGRWFQLGGSAGGRPEIWSGFLYRYSDSVPPIPSNPVVDLSTYLVSAVDWHKTEPQAVPGWSLYRMFWTAELKDDGTYSVTFHEPYTTQHATSGITQAEADNRYRLRTAPIEESDVSPTLLVNINRFSAGLETKLDGIESGATQDQTGAEIKAAYEAEPDTNVFTNSEKLKLSQLSAGGGTGGLSRWLMRLYQVSASEPTAPTAGSDDGLAFTGNLDSWSAAFPTQVPDGSFIWEARALWDDTTMTLGTWAKFRLSAGTRTYGEVSNTVLWDATDNQDFTSEADSSFYAKYLDFGEDFSWQESERSKLLFNITIGGAGCFHSFDMDVVDFARLNAKPTVGPALTPDSTFSEVLSGRDTTAAICIEARSARIWFIRVNNERGMWLLVQRLNMAGAAVTTPTEGVNNYLRVWSIPFTIAVGGDNTVLWDTTDDQVFTTYITNSTYQYKYVDFGSDFSWQDNKKNDFIFLFEPSPVNVDCRVPVRLNGQAFADLGLNSNITANANFQTLGTGVTRGENVLCYNRSSEAEVHFVRAAKESAVLIIARDIRSIAVEPPFSNYLKVHSITLSGGVVGDGGDVDLDNIANWAETDNPDQIPGDKMENSGAGILADLRQNLARLTPDSAYYVESEKELYKVNETTAHADHPIRLTSTGMNLLDDSGYTYWHGYAAEAIDDIIGASYAPSGSLALVPGADGTLGSDIRAIVYFGHQADVGGDLLVAMRASATFTPAKMKILRNNGTEVEVPLSFSSNLSSRTHNVYLISGTVSPDYFNLFNQISTSVEAFTADIDILDKAGVSYAPSDVTRRELVRLDDRFDRIHEQIFSTYADRPGPIKDRTFIDRETGDEYLGKETEATKDIILDPHDIGGGKYGYSLAKSEAISKPISWLDSFYHKDGEISLEPHHNQSGLIQSVTVYDSDVKDKANPHDIKLVHVPASANTSLYYTLRGAMLDFGSSHPVMTAAEWGSMITDGHGNQVRQYVGVSSSAGFGNLTGFPPGWYVAFDRSDRKIKVHLKADAHRDYRQVMRGQLLKFEASPNPGSDVWYHFRRRLAGSTSIGVPEVGRYKNNKPPIFQEIRLNVDNNRDDSFVTTSVDVRDTGADEPALVCMFSGSGGPFNIGSPNFRDVVNLGNLFGLTWDSVVSTSPDLYRYRFSGPAYPHSLSFGLADSGSYTYAALGWIDQRQNISPGNFGGVDYGFNGSHIPNEYSDIEIRGVRIPIEVAKIVHSTGADNYMEYQYESKYAYGALQQEPWKVGEPIEINLVTDNEVHHGKYDIRRVTFPTWRASRWAINDANGKMTDEAKQDYWDVKTRTDKIETKELLGSPVKDFEKVISGGRYYRSAEEPIHGIVGSIGEAGQVYRQGSLEVIPGLTDIRDNKFRSETNTSIAVNDVRFRLESTGRTLRISYYGVKPEPVTLVITRFEDGFTETIQAQARVELIHSTSQDVDVPHVNQQRRNFFWQELVTGDYKVNQTIQIEIKSGSNTLTYDRRRLIYRPT